MIYQGEPVSFMLRAKENGAFLPSLSGKTLEAILKNNFDSQVVKAFSTAKGTITIGTYVDGQTTVGYASFALTAQETQNMCGDYSIELAEVISNGRSIGIANDIITINPAIIKGGVE